MFTIFSLISNNIVIYVHVRKTLRANQKLFQANQARQENSKSSNDGDKKDGNDSGSNGNGSSSIARRSSNNNSLAGMSRLEQKTYDKI